jgi:phosphate/sulfate permease
MLSIALSWVTSPIFAGVIAFGLYWLVLRLIIHAHDPVRLFVCLTPLAFVFQPAGLGI